MKKELKRIGVIYCYTSPNGKKYIGQTVRESRRKSEHKIETSKTETKFGRAIRKHGWENFTYDILFTLKSFDINRIKIVLNVMEKYLIKKYDSYINGYNLNDGGNGNLGYKHTPEMIIKLTEYNRNHSEETNKKKGDANRGMKFSEERKKNMSNSRPNKRSISKHTLEGDFITEYISIAEAATFIEATSQLKTISNKIQECCAGTRKTAYKFTWKYKD